jgi:hypothetical protein
MFIFIFLCLFTFRQHKQLTKVVQFFKGCVAGGYAAKGGRNGPYFFNWFSPKCYILDDPDQIRIGR